MSGPPGADDFFCIYSKTSLFCQTFTPDSRFTPKPSEKVVVSFHHIFEHKECPYFLSYLLLSGITPVVLVSNACLVPTVSLVFNGALLQFQGSLTYNFPDGEITGRDLVLEDASTITAASITVAQGMVEAWLH